MKNIKQTARLIESEYEEIKTKIIELEFASQCYLKALFTPKLENIGFIIIENTVSIYLKNPAFREQFNDWAGRFIEKIHTSANFDKVIEIFNSEIKALIFLGQKEKKISIETALGLFGELLILKDYLLEKKMTQSEIIEGWHRPAPACHDFDYVNHTIEVKTVSRSKRTVKITSEDQLTAVEDKELRLCVYRVENVNNCSVDSLGELYNEIKKILNNGLKNIFEIKCAEDIFCQYLGPKYMPLDYKFIVIEQSIYVVNQKDFPRIKTEKLDIGISRVSYDLDISAIDNFKIK